MHALRLIPSLCLVLLFFCVGVSGQITLSGSLETESKLTLKTEAPGTVLLPGGIAVQPDGKILVAYTLERFPNRQASLVIRRFLTDGTPDKFGTQEILTDEIGEDGIFQQLLLFQSLDGYGRPRPLIRRRW